MPLYHNIYNFIYTLKYLSEKGVFSVTGIKSNTKFQLVKRYSVDRKSGLTSDHTIAIKREDYNLRLRRIGYRDPESGRLLEFLTNNFRLSAKAISQIYKARWEVELFFKEIKQNLHIKSFVGRSENAVMIQLYTSLIVIC